MSRTTMRLRLILSLMLVAFISVFAIASCSPSQSSPSSDGSGTAKTAPAEAGIYVSDEQCLSCHGGSYEAVAERTADLGDWNPHNSIHGGYNACNNCHEADKVISYNYCAQCHVYVPDDEALY